MEIGESLKSYLMKGLVSGGSKYKEIPCKFASRIYVGQGFNYCWDSGWAALPTRRYGNQYGVINITDFLNCSTTENDLNISKIN